MTTTHPRWGASDATAVDEEGDGAQARRTQLMRSRRSKTHWHVEETGSAGGRRRKRERKRERKRGR